MGDHVLPSQGAAPSGQMKEIGRKQEGHGASVSERSKGQRKTIYGLGSVQRDPNTIPSTACSTGDPPEEPDGCAGRRTETYRAKMWTGPVISNGRIVKSEAFGSCYSLACASCVSRACWK